MAGADNLNLDPLSLLTFARQVLPEKEKGEEDFVCLGDDANVYVILSTTFI